MNLSSFGLSPDRSGVYRLVTGFGPAEIDSGGIVRNTGDKYFFWREPALDYAYIWDTRVNSYVSTFASGAFDIPATGVIEPTPVNAAITQDFGFFNRIVPEAGEFDLWNVGVSYQS